LAETNLSTTDFLSSNSQNVLLPNRPEHFADELFRRSFGGQDIETTHHYFNITARELLGSAQSRGRAPRLRLAPATAA